MACTLALLYTLVDLRDYQGSLFTKCTDESDARSETEDDIAEQLCVAIAKECSGVEVANLLNDLLHKCSVKREWYTCNTAHGLVLTAAELQRLVISDVYKSVSNRSR